MNFGKICERLLFFVVYPSEGSYKDFCGGHDSGASAALAGSFALVHPR